MAKISTGIILITILVCAFQASIVKLKTPHCQRVKNMARLLHQFASLACSEILLYWGSAQKSGTNSGKSSQKIASLKGVNL